MKVEYLVPFLLGVVAVLQGGINRQIAKSWGYGTAVLLNNFVLFAVTVVAFVTLWSRAHEWLGPFPGRDDFSKLHWWYFLPGLFGFCLVAGIPFAIAKIGALKLFVGLIGAQLLASLLWDYFVEGMPIAPLRIIGMAVTFLGVLISWRA